MLLKIYLLLLVINLFTSLKCWTLLCLFRSLFLDPLGIFRLFPEWGTCVSVQRSISLKGAVWVEALVILSASLLSFPVGAQGPVASRQSFSLLWSLPECELQSQVPVDMTASPVSEALQPGVSSLWAFHLLQSPFSPLDCPQFRGCQGAPASQEPSLSLRGEGALWCTVCLQLSPLGRTSLMFLGCQWHLCYFLYYAVPSASILYSPDHFLK